MSSTSIGQLWSNYITEADETNVGVADVKPVTSNESVVNQTDENYHNYKKGILKSIVEGGKLNNEPETAQ